MLTQCTRNTPLSYLHPIRRQGCNENFTRHRMLCFAVVNLKSHIGCQAAASRSSKVCSDVMSWAVQFVGWGRFLGAPLSISRECFSVLPDDEFSLSSPSILFASTKLAVGPGRKTNDHVIAIA